MSVADVVGVHRFVLRSSTRPALVAAAALALSIALGAGLGGSAAAASSSGALQEYPLTVQGTGPAAIAAGPNGNVWFTVTVPQAEIGEMTDTGAVTLFTQGLSSTPTAIAGGPDGNVWFTEAANGKLPSGAIGWITPSGAIHETTTGLQAGLAPTGIVTGPDGNLWITESGSAGTTLLRLSPAGAGAAFTTPALAGAQATSPTAGPDGNVWFLLTGGSYGATGAIGRVTPSGSFAVFSAGLTNSGHLAGLAGGPDGNLWFTQSDAGNSGVGSITPTGTIVELPSAPFHGLSPTGITAAADGNLYVTESANHGAVVQITPSGTLTTVVSAPSGLPGAITAMPGGDVWFTESHANGLGRLPIIVPPSGSSSSGGSSDTTGPSGSIGTLGSTGTRGSTGASGASGPSGTASSAPGGLLPFAAPLLGVRAEAKPHGFVLVRTARGGPMVSLSGPVDLPLGSLIDARSGTVRLVLATSGGRTQWISVGRGQFTITQPPSRHGLSILTLVGGSFKACPRVHSAAHAIASVARATANATHVVRQLWAKDNHGQFQTHGQNGVATVRGTVWLTQDRCDGTLTTVIRGVVRVRAHRSRRAVTVTAGHSYLARA